MKKTVLAIIVLLALSGCMGAEKDDEQPISEEKAGVIENPEIMETGAAPFDEIPVSRAVAAKMTALALLESKDIKVENNIDSFGDVNKDAWYAPYVSAAVKNGYMAGKGDYFEPEAPLTVSEAQFLMDKLNANNKISIKITDENKDLPISYALWGQLFMKTIAALAQDKTITEAFAVYETELIPLLTPDNMKTLPPWSMITDKGPYFFRGLNIDAYKDKKISLFVKNGEILLINDVTDSSPVIEGAYVISGENGSIKIFAGGAQRTYKYSKNVNELTVADVKINGETAVEVTAPTGEVSGKVTKITEQYIEVADSKIEKGAYLPVYKEGANEVSFKQLNTIIPGANGVKVYMREGRASAVVIGGNDAPERMRVLIKGDKGNTHSSVQITSLGAFSITETGNERQMNGGEVYLVNGDTVFPPSGKIYIKPVDEGGFLEISSIKRGGALPKYRGTIEISKENDGFLVINEIMFEQYLYSIVSAQMPEDFGLTALKAQSVVARTMAYNLFYENNFTDLGVNADDSVNSYNSAGETETAVTAVNETKGKVLKSGDNVVRPSYFYASSGYTANSGEVWQSGDDFPAETRDHLRAGPQFTKGDYGDLTNEQNAANFFKNTGINAYEKDTPWIRWNVTMTLEEITASVNSNIQARYNAYPSQLLTLTDGEYVSKPIANIGAINNIYITKRGEGGNVMELKISADTGEYLLLTEGCVRTLIRPKRYIEGFEDITLNLANGQTMINQDVLPSGFFVIEANADSVTFYGGGSGHGVGMSQFGAKALGEQGISYEDILRHYFKGCDVADI